MELGETKGQFSARDGDAVLGAMTFSRAGDTRIIVDHTEVADAARGTGVGRQLFDAMVEWARSHQVKVIALCPYAASVFRKVPEARDVLA
ncbi:MAG: GNAT family N-acetyltransferase [Pseudomonadota bacterium]